VSYTVVLDQKKSCKNILEKAFFYIFSGFLFIAGFVSTNFKMVL
jgi:hypothetical protein